MCVCARLHVCVCLGGDSNQYALSTNEGREGPPVQGRWAESSGMGFGDGGCVGVRWWNSCWVCVRDVYACTC